MSHAVPRRAVLLAGTALPIAAAAQGEAPVTIVVPYTPGTGPDTLARLVAPVLQARLGVPVVAENRAGASGNIGTQQVARAAADGRVLLMQVNTFVMNPSLFRQVPYDPIGSFTPIILLTRGELALTVNPDIAADTPAALAALAKARSGGLDYASPGVGTPQHLAMELFRLAAGIEMNHVPYRGSAPAVQDLIGKRVAAMVLPLHTALPLAADGRIKLLAIGSERRAAAAPDVPTMVERGFPDVLVDLWYGLFAPAGLPAAQVAALHAVLSQWLQQPATAAQLRAIGMTPENADPATLGRLVGRDLERWASVIRRAGIVAD